MVDESRVEKTTSFTKYDCPASFRNRVICNFNRTKVVEHFELGMVAVRFESTVVVDTPGSEQERQADFNTFIERCVAGIEAAAREK